MNDERIRQLLQQSIGGLPEPELRRDLWPAMRERIEQRTLRLSPFDWALIAAVIAMCMIFPESILAILYHL